ncbi:YeeE/YedE family protein [Companilactobacillus farciminis]|uniref:YeeE/YedE family protein n=1 Tax=Companilactobacillus farciminis TaxID=1612 RepID=UPI0034D45235
MENVDRSIEPNPIKWDKAIGFVLFFILIIGAPFVLPSNMHYLRLLMGLALGYILSRSYTGFAGSVNRAYKTGSTKLMRTMMFMFLITAIANVTFLMFTKDLTIYALSINPINLGLILGGLLFGFGMAFSSCCATGVMTDLATDLPRAGVTLIFFCLGVFLGFPLQATQSWIKGSIATSATGKKFAQGIYMPDWFKWDGLDGYLGAVILTALLVSFVIYLSYLYEKKRRQKDTYSGVPSERVQDSPQDEDIANFTMGSESTYNVLFKKPWTLKQGAVGMTIIFVLMMGLTKSGWGASTPYGFWFGKVLNIFGVSATSLANFTHQPAAVYSGPFLANGVTVQNMGIFLGAIIFIFTAGLFKQTMHSVSTLNFKSASLFALGGFTMGFGTRLSNGCNVGALYTPIAQFSVSGWIFLAALVLGGIIGNKLSKTIYGY